MAPGWAPFRIGTHQLRGPREPVGCGAGGSARTVGAPGPARGAILRVLLDVLNWTDPCRVAGRPLQREPALCRGLLALVSGYSAYGLRSHDRRIAGSPDAARSGRVCSLPCLFATCGPKLLR